MHADLLLRPIASSDLDIVCHHREAMFIAVGRDPKLVASMRPSTRKWFARKLENGDYYGFLALAGERVVGGVGLLELDWPPHILHPEQTRRGYVLNMYVEAEWRGRGIARALMEASEGEFRRRGVHYAVLHASDAGRPLYEAMGWAATNEMSRRMG